MITLRDFQYWRNPNDIARDKNIPVKQILQFIADNNELFDKHLKSVRVKKQYLAR